MELDDGQNEYIGKGHLLEMREKWFNVYLDVCREIKAVIWLPRGLWIYKLSFKSTTSHEKKMVTVFKYERLYGI